MVGEKLFGSEKKFNLEDRILNAILLVVFCIGLFSLIFDTVKNLGVHSFLFATIITFGFGVLYFFGRRKPNSKNLVWPFIILDISPTIFSWYYFDGISGTCLFFILSLILLVPIITKGINRIVSLVIILLIPLLLFIFELNNLFTITNYRDTTTELFDTFFTFLYIAVGYIIVSLMIINEVRNQRIKLESLNKTKDKFFSIIAHDLRGPLGSIMQLGELIWENQDSIEEDNRKKILYSIHKSSKMTFNLLDNLLQWSRSQSGSLKPKPVELSLKKIVEDNYYLLEEKVKHKKINIDLNLTDNPIICADKDMINTIVRNLISNAIKFTPNNGNIEISSFSNHSDKYCSLQVKDNGVGIKKEFISKLFNIDSGYSTKGTNNESGTGLGLKLCKEFVDLNNGTINLESEENKGTTITISFPCITNNS